MDTVQSTEATAGAGGPGAVTAIRAGLAEIHAANTRADAAEARAAELGRALDRREGDVEVGLERIRALVTECRVRSLEARQARRDARWAVVVGVLALAVVALAALLIFAVTGGPL